MVPHLLVALLPLQDDAGEGPPSSKSNKRAPEPRDSWRKMGCSRVPGQTTARASRAKRIPTSVPASHEESYTVSCDADRLRRWVTTAYSPASTPGIHGADFHVPWHLASLTPMLSPYRALA